VTPQDAEVIPRDGPRIDRGNPNVGTRGGGSGNSPAIRESFLQKRARLLACGRCGALIDWLTAFKQAAEGIELRKGAGCGSKQCSHRYRKGEHTRAQQKYIDGVVNGERKLMRTPHSTADSAWHTMSHEEVERALERAVQRIAH
jgi:hypothetical protein